MAEQILDAALPDLFIGQADKFKPRRLNTPHPEDLVDIVRQLTKTLLDESGQSSKDAEASIRREAMIKRSGRDFPGCEGAARQSRESPRNLGDPAEQPIGNKTIGEVEREPITAKTALSGSRRRP